MLSESLLFQHFADTIKGPLLDWSKRLKIIKGLVEGLVYLHKHSMLHVVHRDLKPNNILLDCDMTPKISDFGSAKTLSSDVTEERTRRVVGTRYEAACLPTFQSFYRFHYFVFTCANLTVHPPIFSGYIAPEYASRGVYSMKTDVFSFGILVLETISGRKNTVLDKRGDTLGDLVRDVSEDKYLR